MLHHDDLKIRALDAIDVRFPTSDAGDGSDAMHTDPDYSAAYVTLTCESGAAVGCGLAFTIGRGNELCVAALRALAPFIEGRTLGSITRDFAGFWRSLTSEPQLRWVGPEKGVIHLATAAVVNAVWDLWAKVESQPLWRWVTDLPPEVLVSALDLRYLSDALTREQALEMLEAAEPGKAQRVAELERDGFPAYTTSVGWLGYDDDKIRRLVQEGLDAGWTHFKMKVGADPADDLARARMIRAAIGPECELMTDANQRWDVPEAIERMRALAEVRPLWIEEPTSPDDVLGHATIARALEPLGIGVATGEQCQNRVVFKQLLQADAIRFCQIDSCRLGGVNEVLAVMLLAKRFGVPVCPHAGGVGLCEHVAHLVMVDHARIGCSTEGRVAEWVDHLHEHFVAPCTVRGPAYVPPTAPGYGVELRPESIEAFRFPEGPVWRDRLAPH